MLYSIDFDFILYLNELGFFPCLHFLHLPQDQQSNPRPELNGQNKRGDHDCKTTDERNPN